MQKSHKQSAKPKRIKKPKKQRCVLQRRQKIPSRTNTKKDIFQKHKDQNQKHNTPMNRQHTHKALITRKKSLSISKMSKLKKHSIAKTRS